MCLHLPENSLQVGRPSCGFEVKTLLRFLLTAGPLTPSFLTDERAFVLRDTARLDGFPMEVLGMTTAYSLARRVEKEVDYAANFGLAGWWPWNAAEKLKPPRLLMAVRGT